MKVVGGCYRETCETPNWNALYGSGGRAAAALADLDASLEFFTYRPAGSLVEVNSRLSARNAVHSLESNSEIVFSYFHPLSKPVIHPAKDTLKVQGPIRVSGDVILRFGMMEGEAIVDAERVVFDPQTCGLTTSFYDNGSQARRLALVLNEAELSLGNSAKPLTEVALEALSLARADVVVVKRGVRGALVATRSDGGREVPPFHTSQIFKIGSGDVFSAAFSYFWGCAQLHPFEAADLASRSAAGYCESMNLPIRSRLELDILKPVTRFSSQALLVGQRDTLALRWLFEEAKWRLIELGLTVFEADASGDDQTRGTIDSVLILAEGMPSEKVSKLRAAYRELHTVVLDETGGVVPPFEGAKVTDDFTTAIYWSAWRD